MATKDQASEFDTISTLADTDKLIALDVSATTLNDESGAGGTVVTITYADLKTLLNALYVAAGSKPSDLAADVATTQAGTTYTVDADDDCTTVVFSNDSLVTVTLPTDATDDLRDGYRVLLFADGDAGLTLSTTGLALKGSSPNKSCAVNEGIYAEKIGADTWVIIGGTAA